MARTWLSVTVELLGGRGEELWPWPGRVFAVGPSHTFADLATAIDDAFARWDRSHLSQFVLDDGRMVTDAESGAELQASGFGPVPDVLDIAGIKVMRTIELGAVFEYIFDLGDDWTHQCTVGTQKIDPREALGILPDAPLPYWGWGNIPDQYGRRWFDDDREGPVPPRPGTPHPMLTGAWPERGRTPVVDVREVGVAVRTGDPERFVAAVTGREIEDALQQVGAGIPMVLASGVSAAEPLALAVINGLRMRDGVGDRVLADDLLALLRKESPARDALPVDLDMLLMFMEGDPMLSTGGYVDRRTGDVIGDEMEDVMIDGEDGEFDPEDDPDRWLRVDRGGSRDGWEDMSAFAAKQRDAGLRARLEQAIEGKGAFRRFRDLVHAEGLAEQWDLYSTDRQWGRAREFLAEGGIRVA